MKYSPICPELFITNRSRFRKEMLPGSIAIFVSNDEMPSNGDALYTFKQNSDLFWLTGVTQEDSMVILFPDHPEPKYREVLVLVKPNELKEKWDGKRLRADEAKALSGIQTIVWLESVDSLLQPWVHMADHIYLDSNENDRKGSLVQTREYKFIEEMKKRYPLHQYQRAARIMKKLRAVKTPLEVAVLEEAAAITHRAFTRLLKFIRPGVMEYEIEAEIYHSFLSQRSPGPAYGSIIASGDRARTLHYVANNGECKDGELILMDFGAEYGGYCADLTRTVPVNGRFTKRQKEVYNGCLQVHNYAKSLLKPGITISEYHKKVGEQMNVVLQKIGLVSETDIRNQTPENPAWWKYMYHGVSHHLGIDVHDLGTRTEPISAGMVLTVEPGIYIEEEQIGIRIENDVWITEDGNKDLMADIPITAEEIETLMASHNV
ncbi:MAG: aminopeptidase P N-terminal domain-containing protein [Puia sp.]|nr:aminopeptidase P N-terminal domain-containing protein [Puia sp.]